MGIEPNAPSRYPVPELPEGAIVVLPASVEGDMGIYPNGALMLVKEMRAAGIPAQFLHDPEHRQWQVHMGEIPLDLLIGVSSGLISSGIWASFSHLVGNHFPKQTVHLHVVRQRRKADGSLDSTTVELTGTGPQLKPLLETALKDEADDDGR
jgi:hypothetical protein